MFQHFQHPPQGFGPGSQPQDEAERLDYLAMPSGMRTFASHLPEIEDPDRAAPTLALLAALSGACAQAAATGKPAAFDLAAFDEHNRALLAETLGEGEVSCRLAGRPALEAQESVFAGVWTVRGEGIDRIEVGPVPQAVRARAFAPTRPAGGEATPRCAGVVNAPAIVTEILDRSAAFHEGDTAHVVNLSLLPHTPEDLDHLVEAFGEGSVTVLSRGYGNCRVSASATAHLWRVQFFNSMDTLILDTFEVTDVPEVAIAAREDFEDSAKRLADVLEALK